MWLNVRQLRCAWRVGLFRTQLADRILDAADLVITIGYDPVEFEPGLWNRGKRRDLIHIDVMAADIDNDYRPRVELTGSIAATLRELTSHTNGIAPTGGAELLREVASERAAFGEEAAALSGTPVHPMRLVPYRLSETNQMGVTVAALEIVVACVEI